MGNTEALIFGDEGDNSFVLIQHWSGLTRNFTWLEHFGNSLSSVWYGCELIVQTMINAGCECCLCHVSSFPFLDYNCGMVIFVDVTAFLDM